MDIKDKITRRAIGGNCVCFNLRRAARLVTQRYEAALKDTGIRATQFPLLLAACGEEGILLTKMARLLGMDRTSLSRNLNIIEAKGWVNVEKGQDKREHLISITDEGLKALETALPLWQTVQDEVVEALGPEKWGHLLEGLHEVAQKM